ncbi:putative membrane protein [Rubidibacter lacunae KORDI 51-2]|uniref:Putative membrane protein n=1 Tax=Rubidibacter lacunae KORDI 51-2 TaxID=582515 RepID=U5DKF4_9CHRO|nr:NnrU family protein [Rubidibacter lacunae]ERN41397.1 putative membrane protein [Rubidibacter lacunae KORDI 51-2]
MSDLTWLTPSHWTILALILGFAVVHSGMAALRSRGERLLGARFYRILFALASVPFAAVLILYFIAHRYDGLMLWHLQGVPGVRALVWALSALSFVFLYPATFNLLEIAAIQKPEIHLYEAGIVRISRHPQMVGQIIWCAAHALWLGTTFTLVTCFGLIAHHLFAVWHGDRRWQQRYGDAFAAAKARTSIIPFRAALDGRQSLHWQEFLRPAYLGVALFVGLLWWAHPWLLVAAEKVI